MRVYYTDTYGDESELTPEILVGGFAVAGGRVEAEPGDDDEHVRKVRDRLAIFVALCRPYREQVDAARAARGRACDAIRRRDAATANAELASAPIPERWPLLTLFLLTSPDQCPMMWGKPERKSAAGFLPAQLTDAPRWIVWRMSPDGKKLPYRATNARGRSVSATDPANWSDFATAAQHAMDADGVGFVLGDGWAGVDLDDCIDEQGAVFPWADAIVKELDSYAEVSPSGRGLKVFVKCAAPIRSQKRAGLEIYGAGRYFTVTGRHWSGTPTTVEERGDALAAIAAREFGTAARPAVLSSGGRNNGLASLAGSMRRRGMSQDAILAALRAENQRCASPLDDAEVEAVAKSVSRYEPSADTYEKTDKGNAEFFADLYKDLVRYDHRQRRWLVFAGHRWVPDADGAMIRCAIRSVDERLRIATEDTTASDRADRIKHALRSQGRAAIDSVIALAKAIKPIADAGDAWDADRWLLGVENGVVDLRTGELADGLPEDRVTMSARAHYDPAAACPLWERTIREIFGADDALAAYAQRALGYSLTGDCSEECLFFCWGDGANGKGTLMNTFAWVLGDYADNLSATALEQMHRASGGATPEIAKLPGRRFLTASEFGEASRLNESRVKALTGRDPVTARALYGQEFTFAITAKIWLATNARPTVRDDSEGFWRRMQMIPFTQSFADRADKTLKDRLRAEAPGILAWAVRGAIAWRHDGLGTPDAVRAATADYRRENDPLTPFLDERCVIRDGIEIQSKPLFDAYLRWCDARREPPRFNRTTFGKQVKKRFEAEERRNVTFYRGLALRDFAHDEASAF